MPLNFLTRCCSGLASHDGTVGIVAYTVGSFLGDSNPLQIEHPANRWALAGSVCTVLIVSIFKFLTARERTNAERESKILDVVLTAIDTKRQEKHNVMDVTNAALSALQGLKRGDISIDDVDVKALIQEARERSKPIVSHSHLEGESIHKTSEGV